MPFRPPKFIQVVGDDFCCFGSWIRLTTNSTHNHSTSVRGDKAEKDICSLLNRYVKTQKLERSSAAARQLVNFTSRDEVPRMKHPSLIIGISILETRERIVHCVGPGTDLVVLT